MDGGIEVKYNKVLPENKAETIRILSLLSLVVRRSFEIQFGKREKGRKVFDRIFKKRL